MNNVENFTNWVMSLGAIYIAAIMIMLGAFAFLAVCAGVAILRISKRFERPRDENRQEELSSQRGQHRQDGKHAPGTREALERFQGRGRAERPPTTVEDQKYWPPSAK